MTTETEGKTASPALDLSQYLDARMMWEFAATFGLEPINERHTLLAFWKAEQE